MSTNINILDEMYQEGLASLVAQRTEREAAKHARIRIRQENIQRKVPIEILTGLGLNIDAVQFLPGDLAVIDGACAFGGYALTTHVSCDNYGRVDLSIGGNYVSLDEAMRANVGIELARAARRKEDERKQWIASMYKDARDRSLNNPSLSSKSLNGAGLPPENLAEIRRIVAARWHEERARRRAERGQRQDEQARRRERAQQLIDCCAEWSALEKAHQERCRRWADHWTEGLWQSFGPTELWRVWYAPLTPVPVPKGENWLQEIVCLEAPADIVQQPAPAAVTRVTAGGKLEEDVYIGAFVRAERVADEQPTSEVALFYYRSVRAGNYVVNVPCVSDADPTVDAPVREHGLLSEWLAAHSFATEADEIYWRHIAPGTLDAMDVDKVATWVAI